MKSAKDFLIPFTWENRRPFLGDGFFYVPPAYEHTAQEMDFFEKKGAVQIEFCSGNGQWIVEKAKENPDQNWLAVEKKFERARQIWRKMQKEGLRNLTVVCSEGRLFTQMYAPVAEKIYINFPDPWPKSRHAKHRLICPLFLQDLLRIVPVGGQVCCTTDDLSYIEQTKMAFSSLKNWKLESDQIDWLAYGCSFFSELWKKKGKELYYLSYERIC